MMRVRTFIFLLIFACCACALFVFWELNSTYSSSMNAQESLSQKNLALRDLSNLEVTFNQWLLLSDLLLGNDQTYLHHGAIETSEKLGHLVETMDQQLAFSPSTKSFLTDFKEFCSRQTSRLNKASELTSVDRSARLNELLSEMDLESSQAIDALAKIRGRIERALGIASAHLVATEFSGKMSRVILAIFFLSATSLLWFICSRFLSRPIAMLTNDSNLAMRGEHQISRISSGPAEINKLRNSFVDLVDNLNDKIKQVHQEQLQRDEMHDEMIRMSRKAGMAEVASGVLHNVGNVLNSLNVSATVMRKQLDESVIEKLVFARDVIIKNKSDLPAGRWGVSYLCSGGRNSTICPNSQRLSRQERHSSVNKL